MPSLRSLPSDREEHKSKIHSNTSRHLAECREVARIRLWFSFCPTRHFYSARNINSTDSEWRLRTLKSSARKARCLCTRAFCRGCYHLRETKRGEQRREQGQGWGLKRYRGRRREKEGKTGTGTEAGWETRTLTETGKDTGVRTGTEERTRTRTRMEREGWKEENPGFRRIEK